MINITARNFKLTDGIKNAIHDKLNKVRKFIPNGEVIYVVLENNKYGQEIEVSFKAPRKSVRVSSIDEDLYVAIDSVGDKIDKIIKRNSERIHDKSGKDSIRYGEYPSPSETYQQNADQETRIVKRKYFSYKPMLEKEAIAQMELLKHKTFLFHNASTGRPSMMYKRNDDNYGIIELE